MKLKRVYVYAECGVYYSVLNVSHDLIILIFHAKSAVSSTRFNVNYVHMYMHKRLIGYLKSK